MVQPDLPGEVKYLDPVRSPMLDELETVSCKIIPEELGIFPRGAEDQPDSG